MYTDTTSTLLTCYYCQGSVIIENEEAFHLGWSLLDNGQWACPHCVYVNKLKGEY